MLKEVVIPIYTRRDKRGKPIRRRGSTGSMINVPNDRKPNESPIGIAHWDDTTVYAVNTLTPNAVVSSPLDAWLQLMALVYTNLGR